MTLAPVRRPPRPGALSAASGSVARYPSPAASDSPPAATSAPAAPPPRPSRPRRPGAPAHPAPAHPAPAHPGAHARGVRPDPGSCPDTAPAPTPAPAPVAVATSAGDDPGDYDDYDEDELDGYPGPRWIGLTTIARRRHRRRRRPPGAAWPWWRRSASRPDQRFGVPDDLFHRIGYPFGSLGSTAMFFLLLAAVLLAPARVVGEEVTDRQYAIAGAALRTALVLGVIVALGSILAVRGSLHEYSAKNVAVPGFVRVQFTSFLLATLGSAALAIVGALAALARTRRHLIVRP